MRRKIDFRYITTSPDGGDFPGRDGRQNRLNTKLLEPQGNRYCSQPLLCGYRGRRNNGCSQPFGLSRRDGKQVPLIPYSLYVFLLDERGKSWMPNLRRVVVATDDSGPWGDDVIFLLYSGAAEPGAIFPLEAAGTQDFVAWLTTLPGYRDRELAQAMSSTDVARFTVYDSEL